MSLMSFTIFSTKGWENGTGLQCPLQWRDLVTLLCCGGHLDEVPLKRSITAINIKVFWMIGFILRWRISDQVGVACARMIHTSVERRLLNGLIIIWISSDKILTDNLFVFFFTYTLQSNVHSHHKTANNAFSFLWKNANPLIRFSSRDLQSQCQGALKLLWQPNIFSCFVFSSSCHHLYLLCTV